MLERIGVYFHNEITGESLHTLESIGKNYRDHLIGDNIAVKEYKVENFYLPLLLAFL